MGIVRDGRIFDLGDVKMKTEKLEAKGNFFEFIPPPIECSECKHPRRIFGNNAICLFCKKEQEGEYWVLGKKLNPHDYHDFMEAGEEIFRHLNHQMDFQSAQVILSEGLYIWSYAINIISAKASAAEMLVIEFASKLNCLMAMSGIKDSEMEEAMKKAAEEKRKFEKK